MSDDPVVNRSPLLPDRYPQGDFFVCDIFDAVPKADMASMEHPIFSLSTKPDTRVREYEHNGIKIAMLDGSRLRLIIYEVARIDPPAPVK